MKEILKGASDFMQDGEHGLGYCGDLVRQHDPDRFLLSLFAPEKAREALWALFAFNYEVAKTREVVSETMLGQIRLQWWRDALAKIYDDPLPPDGCSATGVLEHEVVKPLAAAIREYDLPREELEALIYAREFDLEGVAPAHLEGLLIYLEHTNKPMLSLVMRILGADEEQEQLHALALNYGIAGILRAVPVHAQQRRCYLPSDLLEKHGVRESWLYEMKQQDGLPEVVRTVAVEFTHGLKPREPFLRKSNKLAAMHMRRFEKAGYDYHNPRLHKPIALRELRLLLA